ncbi:MAG: CoA transferase [Dehalococcoidia bacterium]|nr:CoA transferase [Dehalococcoidia bacterium]
MLPLEGYKVLDLSRLAPGPFCSMALSDMGADVLLVEAPPAAVANREALPPQDGKAERAAAFDPFRRNKRSLQLNLREESAREVFYELARGADVVLEGARPGVVKRLGVDYETISGINPRIVYCSLSGYGQDGPYVGLVGHDINYISIGGALGMIGWPEQKPTIPLNLLADFAGGGLMAAFAIVTALLAREKTGRGQFVDIAMSDGVMYLLAMFAGQYFATGKTLERGANLLNGAAPHYNVYETADSKWISLGSLEPHFFANLCRLTGREDFTPHEYESSKWPEMHEHFTQQFRSKTRDEWFAILGESDVCVAPVYDFPEAVDDPQNRHRQMIVELEHPEFGTIRHVGIAPKFSDTRPEVRSTGVVPGANTDEVLGELGYSTDRISALRASGAAA